jgi:hypothetical protein
MAVGWTVAATAGANRSLRRFLFHLGGQPESAPQIVLGKGLVPMWKAENDSPHLREYLGNSACLLQLERLDILTLNIPGDGGLWFYRAIADRVNSISERNQAAVVAD